MLVKASNAEQPYCRGSDSTVSDLLAFGCAAVSSNSVRSDGASLTAFYREQIYTPRQQVNWTGTYISQFLQFHVFIFIGHRLCNLRLGFVELRFIIRTVGSSDKGDNGDQ